jgi:glycosyltransferase involved in cell wall biosynthesis
MKFVRQDNAGLNKTLNRALSMASGKYVSILASDDRYLPIHSETLVKAFETAALDNLSFVYADVDLIDTNGASLGRTQFQGKGPRSGRIFEDILLFRYYPQGSANLYLADELRRVGGFNEKYLGEGLDLYLRLTCGSNALFVDKAVSQYRVRSGTLNSATDRHIPDRLEIWFRNLDAYPKSADAQWRRRAISVLYRKFGQDYYNGRVLDEARRWFMKSLRHDSMNGETIQFVLRSLVLSLLSRIGIAR